MIKKRISDFKELIGPGFITAALVLGPGSLTVTSKIGANYQFYLLWLVPICVLMMSVFCLISTRIGVSSDLSLLQLIKLKYGRFVCILIGLGLFIVTAMFQTGNATGAGIVFSEMFGMSSIPWIVFFSLLASLLLFFKSFFKILEKVMIVMVIIMLLSFVITLIISKPNSILIFQQFNFSIPSGSEFLAVALVASTFSIAGAFYQSYLVQEKGTTKKQGKLPEKESISGVIILGLITSMVMLVAGSVLYPKGIQVNSATEMGRALEPIFGNYATIIFMLGLFAASFSSLIGNATLGGVMISDALGLGRKLEKKRVRFMILLVIIIGASIAIIFGNLPIKLIIMAQGITILVVPAIGLLIYLIALDKAKRKELELGAILKTIAIIGIVLLFVLASINTYSLFIK